MSSFSVKRVENKVILKVNQDPGCAGDLVPFIQEYEKLLKTLNHKKERVVLLMDLRALKLSASNPKFDIIDLLNRLFTGLKPISEKTLLGTALIMSSRFVSDAIETAIAANPGSVPFRCVTSVNQGKEFLKMCLTSRG